MHLVIALNVRLGRHLPLAAVANGLLQLGKARTIDERLRVGKVRRPHGRCAFALWPMAGHAIAGEDFLALDRVGLDPFGQAATVQVGQHEGGNIGHALITEALYMGLENTIQAYLKRLAKW